MRAGHSDRRRHARVEGSPGVDPRLRGLARMVWPLPVAAAVAGYLIRTALPVPDIPTPVAGVLILALSAGILAFLHRSRRRLAHFNKGAQGEESVARELALLPARYVVFHGVRIPSRRPGVAEADCDHVVVGPRGVAVVETKNWAGPIEIRDERLWVGGKEPDRPPLEQVKRAANALAAGLARNDLASVPVRPILVFASDALPVAAQGLQGVRLCRLDALRRTVGEDDTPELPEGVQARIAACVRPWVNVT